MTVKDRVGRVRHIAFRLSAGEPIARADLAAAIRSVGAQAGIDPPPELTVFDGDNGLVRVRHVHALAARAAITKVASVGRRAIPVRIETLGTSGTMRAARRKWLSGEAAVRRRPRR